MPKETITTFEMKSEREDIRCIRLVDCFPEEVTFHIRERARFCSDRILPFSSTAVDPLTGNLIEIHNEGDGPLIEEFPHTVYAMGQMLTYLKIPRPYFRRCPSNLKAENFNYWVEMKGEKEILVRMWEGVARAFFTTRYNPEMDDKFVFPPILEALTEVKEKYPHHLTFEKTPGITNLSARFDELHTRAADGVPWVIKAGLRVTNSEIGLSALRIQPIIFAYREGTDYGPDDVIYLADYSAPGASRFRHTGELKLEIIREAFEKAVSVASQAVVPALVQLMTPIKRSLDKEVEHVVGLSPFLTESIVDGVSESLASLIGNQITKGDISHAVIRAARQYIPFQTRMHEIMEVERSMAKYLGFLSGLEAQVGKILSLATIEENAEEEATPEITTESPLFTPTPVLDNI